QAIRPGRDRQDAGLGLSPPVPVARHYRKGGDRLSLRAGGVESGALTKILRDMARPPWLGGLCIAKAEPFRVSAGLAGQEDDSFRQFVRGRPDMELAKAAGVDPPQILLQGLHVVAALQALEHLRRVMIALRG